MIPLFRPLVLALCCLCYLSACSSTEVQEDSVKEIPVEAVVASDLPETELFSSAKRQYEQGLYSVAVSSFEALSNAFPLGPYAEFARIKMADCHYKLTKYEEAAAAFESFAKNYPSSPARPYALLMAARSLQIDFNGIGTDTEPLQRSRDMYTSLIQEYPDSVYSNTAKVFRREALATIAQSEHHIANYYQRMGNEKAYLARNDYFKTHWASKLTSPAPSALPEMMMANQRIPESPDPESVPGNPAQMRAQLSQQKALALLDDKVSMSRESAYSEPSATDSPRTLLKNVQCRSTPEATVFLTFSRSLSDAQERIIIPESRTITSNDGSLRIPLPEVILDSETKDCFSSNDLTLDSSGNLELKSKRDAVVFQLSNPPRLMITLQ